MARMRNEAAEIPIHLRAVIYRQHARDAEYRAHQSQSPEAGESYRRLAQLWLALAEQMDSVSDTANGARPAVEPLHLSGSH